MALSFQGVGAIGQGTTGTTTNVPYPTPGGGILAGDLLVLKFVINNLTGGTTPAGYTSDILIDSAALSPSLRISHILATGGETGNLVVSHTNAIANRGYLECWRGVDQTTPMDVAGSSASFGAVAAYNIPSVTTTMTGVGLSYAATNNSVTGTYTPPTVPATFTEDQDSITQTPGFTGGQLIWSGSGATGVVNLTRSTSIRGCAGLIAIRPAVDAAWPIIVQPPRR